MKNEEGFAPVLAVLASIIFLTAMDAAIKVLSATFATGQIVTMRYACGALVALLVFAFRPSAVTLLSLRTSFFRSIVIVSTASLFFYALSELPLAEVVTISFISPLILVGLSAVFLKEKAPPRAIWASLIGLVGIAIVMIPELTSGVVAQGSLRGYGAVLAGSVGYALLLMLTRKHSGHDSPQAMVVLQASFCALLALPFGLSSWQMPDGADILLAVFIGFLGTGGQLLMTLGYGRAVASRLAPLDYTAFLWASLFGYVLFGDVPHALTFLGAGLIIFACLLAARQPAANRQRPTANVHNA